MKLKSTIALAVLALGSSAALAQKATPTQGVSKNEIVIGSIQDLSGPIAAFGKQVRFGMQLRVDELNEQSGGIHGRKIKLLIEDSQYDPKKAVLAAQKLVNQDKVFVMVAHVGTTNNLATMPILFEKNVPNFYPITASRQMAEPYHKLKFAPGASYFDQLRIFAPRVAKEKNVKKPCSIVQDDDFGQEVADGAEAGLKTINLSLAEKTTFKTGATDFSSQVSRMKAAGCDMVILGTIIRETLGTVGESRKTGFSPVFLGSSAVYTDLNHKLARGTTEGLYGVMTVANPYLDDASPQIRFWATKYQTKFNEEPTVFSIYGYQAIDQVIIAANKVGPNLTSDSFVKALETVKFPPDIFGGPEVGFGPNKRQGSDMSRLSQIIGGKWKVVSEYAK
ncbi:MAG: ABC transporter substrate-binding protein [Burkholderiaceae bacterium]